MEANASKLVGGWEAEGRSERSARLRRPYRSPSISDCVLGRDWMSNSSSKPMLIVAPAKQREPRVYYPEGLILGSMMNERIV
jgi:hypothetical protein